MKKYIFIVLALSTIIILTSSCSYEEPDLFEYSAAERLSNSMKNAKNTLISAENGWEMLYFIDGAAAGYNMLVKFDADLNVTVAANNALTTSNVYKSDTTTWNVIGDNGPVLTFDTYNQVLHAFSDPQRDGIGNGGDYEFIIVAVSDNQIKLKGKKNNVYIYLNKLSSNINWKNYFSEVKAMQTTLFSNNNTLDLNIGGVMYNAYYGSNGYLTIVNDGGDPTSVDAPVYGFVTTPTGIHLHNKLENGNVSAQDFILSETKTQLAAQDAIFFVNSPILYIKNFMTNTAGWSINITDINETLSDHIANVNTKLASFGGPVSHITSLQFAYNKDRASYVLKFGYKLDGAIDKQDFDFDIITSGDQITLKYKGTQTDGATTLLNVVTGVNNIIADIDGVYTITSSVALINPTLGLKLVKTTDTSSWFNITGGSL